MEFQTRRLSRTLLKGVSYDEFHLPEVCLAVVRWSVGECLKMLTEASGGQPTNMAFAGSGFTAQHGHTLLHFPTD